MKRLSVLLFVLLVFSCGRRVQNSDNVFRCDVRQCLDSFLADSCQSLPFISVFVAERPQDTLLIFYASELFSIPRSNLFFVEQGTSIITVGEISYGNHIVNLSYITDEKSFDSEKIDPLIKSINFDVDSFNNRVDWCLSENKSWASEWSMVSFSICDSIRKISDDMCKINHIYKGKEYSGEDASHKYHLKIDPDSNSFQFTDNDESTYGRIYSFCDSVLFVPDFVVLMSKLLHKPIFKRMDSLDVELWGECNAFDLVSDDVIKYSNLPSNDECVVYLKSGSPN